MMVLLEKQVHLQKEVGAGGAISRDQSEDLGTGLAGCVGEDSEKE